LLFPHKSVGMCVALGDIRRKTRLQSQKTASLQKLPGPVHITCFP